MTSRFDVRNTEIIEVKLIFRKPIEDNRGFFERIFCSEELKEITHGKEIVQVNHSLSRLKGTVRGMHFQRPPYAEIKIVSCLKGKVFDVAVDIRRGSPTFLKYHAEILSEDNHRMLAIPEGFAHGFQTLEDNTELIYFHTSKYNPAYESGLNPNDKRLRIKWPLMIEFLSYKDSQRQPMEDDFEGLEL